MASHSANILNIQSDIYALFVSGEVELREPTEENEMKKLQEFIQKITPDKITPLPLRDKGRVSLLKLSLGTVDRSSQIVKHVKSIP